MLARSDAQELISTLKARLETSERRVRALEAGGATAAASGSARAADDEELREVERQRDAGRIRERELQEEGAWPALARCDDWA